MTDRLAKLTALLSAEPSDPFLLYSIAQEHAKANDHAAAIGFYDRCIAADPRHCYAYFHKARSLQAAGNLPAARATAAAGLRAAHAGQDPKAASELAALATELSESHPATPTEPPLDDRGLPAGYQFKPDWELTPPQAHAALRAPAPPLLLDVRTPDEHATARIAGSVLIPLQDLEKRLDELEADDGSRRRPIIVHCYAGGRSMKATALLRASGFADVRSMAGGIDAWSRAIDPSVPRYTMKPATPAPPAPNV